MVQRYRKKSVDVTATQLLPDNVKEVAQWCGASIVEEIDPVDDGKRFVALNIPTIKGLVRAQQGDFILQGPQGGFSTCPASEFEKLYEVI